MRSAPTQRSPQLLFPCRGRKLEYTLIKNLHPHPRPRPLPHFRPAPSSQKLFSQQHPPLQSAIVCNTVDNTFSAHRVQQLFSSVQCSIERQLQMSPPPLSLLSTAFIGRLGHTSHWNTMKHIGKHYNTDKGAHHNMGTFQTYQWYSYEERSIFGEELADYPAMSFVLLC